MNLIVHKYGLVLSITINFRKLEYNEPHHAIDSAESQYMATLVPKSHLCLCIKKAVTMKGLTFGLYMYILMCFPCSLQSW